MEDKILIQKLVTENEELSNLCDYLYNIIELSFQPLTSRQIEDNCHLLKCEHCNWWGSSSVLDYVRESDEFSYEEDEDICPLCFIDNLTKKL